MFILSDPDPVQLHPDPQHWVNCSYFEFSSLERKKIPWIRDILEKSKLLLRSLSLHNTAFFITVFSTYFLRLLLLLTHFFRLNASAHVFTSFVRNCHHRCTKEINSILGHMVFWTPYLKPGFGMVSWDTDSESILLKILNRIWPMTKCGSGFLGIQMSHNLVWYNQQSISYSSNSFKNWFVTAIVSNHFFWQFSLLKSLHYSKK